MNKKLHIVCPFVPWPVNSGMSIDVFYKIKALYQAGVKIQLHYFSANNAAHPTELNQFCDSIYIYPPVGQLHNNYAPVPDFKNRKSLIGIIENLQKDNHPILLEGVQLYPLFTLLKNTSRNIVMRLHKDQGDFYKCLVHSSGNWLKKLTYLKKSRTYRQLEHSLSSAISYAGITSTEVQHFKKEHGLQHVFHQPPYTPFQEVVSIEGIGGYCLYFADLSSPENEKAAAWLLSKVFSSLKIPLVIAGKSPSDRLKKLTHLYQHCCIVANPSSAELEDLIKKAQISVLPAFHSTGVSIKLLQAITQGRHCIINDEMANNSPLAPACHIGNTVSAFQSIIHQLFRLPFEEHEIILRRKLLKTMDVKNDTSLLQGYLFRESEINSDKR